MSGCAQSQAEVLAQELIVSIPRGGYSEEAEWSTHRPDERAQTTGADQYRHGVPGPNQHRDPWLTVTRDTEKSARR